MMGAIGFLGMQMSELNNLYYATQTNKQNYALDADQVTDKIAVLEKKISEQEKTIATLNKNMNETVTNFASLSTSKFIPSPQHSVDSSYFNTKTMGKNAIEVVGSKEKINSWIERNEIYFDYMLKKSLPLEYDRASRRVAVSNIIPGSIFHKMGLRDGDKILNINGQVFNRGADLRAKLINFKNKNLAILRDGKRMNFSIKYKDQIENEVNFSFSKAKFNETLSELTSLIKTVPAEKDGKVFGVKILGIEENKGNLFSQMEIQPTDIITRINGTEVTDQQIITALETAGNSLKIDYLRGNKPDHVIVSFKK